MKKIFIALFLLNICSSFNCSNPEPEDYLLPKGFIGRATVIFNQKQGTPPKYENRRRVYEIPANGILLTQFKPEYGIISPHYYYVERSGKRMPLPVYLYEYNKDGTTRWIVQDANKPGIFLNGTTGQYADEDNAPFQLFIVSNYNQLDTFYTKEYQRNFDEKINKLIGTNL
jgi:hypothetical protein